jgi:hypothetical protein
MGGGIWRILTDGVFACIYLGFDTDKFVDERLGMNVLVDSGSGAGHWILVDFIVTNQLLRECPLPKVAQRAAPT